MSRTEPHPPLVFTSKKYNFVVGSISSIEDVPFEQVLIVFIICE